MANQLSFDSQFISVRNDWVECADGSWVQTQGSTLTVRRNAQKAYELRCVTACGHGYILAEGTQKECVAWLSALLHKLSERNE